MSEFPNYQWIGCQECDPAFPCFDGKKACFRLYASPQPEPEPSLSQRMKEAGYTKRDTCLTCDECGAKFTAQFAPLHECAAPPAAPQEPEKAMDTGGNKNCLHCSGHSYCLYCSDWSEYTAAPQEPMAWITDRETLHFDKEDARRDCDGFIQPLYTAAQKKLTDVENTLWPNSGMPSAGKK